MPPKLKKNVLIMVANIGSSSSDKDENGESFLNKTKTAMKSLLLKKIFLQPKDEIGIITMGDDTDNPDDVDYVRLYHENLLIPNWEMVEYVDNLISKTHPNNWIEALYVTLNYIRKEVFNPEVTTFVVIFNNFKEDEESINQFESDVIIEALKSFENMKLLGESPHIANSFSEIFAKSVMRQTEAQYEGINSFIEATRLYAPCPTSAMPWRFDLEWSGFIIPCTSYVKVVSKVSQLGTWKMQALRNSTDLSLVGNTSVAPGNESTVNVVKEKIHTDHFRNEIKPHQIINGYKFGGNYVPLSEEAEESMKYGGSSKGMMIYGFVPQNEMKIEYWSGAGSRIVVPATEKESEAFYSLVNAMNDENLVAIVRKVYQNNNAPKMGVLFPRIEDDTIHCLVHLELPYGHDIRVIQKRPIKPILDTVEKEKIDAIGGFIDSMTLTDDEPGYLDIGMFPHVPNQYHWNALADRALNREKPVASVEDSFLQKYLEPPTDLKNKAKPVIDKMEKLFRNCKFEKKEKKIKDRTKVDEVEEKVEEKVENKKEISAVKETESMDEGFFTREDVDVKMDELDDM